MTGPAAREAGLRAILVYKVARAVLWLVVAVALTVLGALGALDRVRELADALRHHLAARWSLSLAEALVSLLSTRVLHLVQVGLVLDAVLSAVEGWALWRGHRWGAWLVVVASALPLPLELYHLARHPSPWRLAILVANLVIVAYLFRWLGRHRHDPAA
jgi:uncharacterized membrane protein (DUF2068 family)